MPKTQCIKVYATSNLVTLVGDALILQNPDLNAPVFCAPGGSFVIGDRLGITISEWLHQPPQIQIMHTHQVLNYGLCASFAERAVSRRVAGLIREPHYHNEPTVGVPLGLFSVCPGGGFIDCLVGGCVENTAYLEEDWDCAR